MGITDNSRNGVSNDVPPFSCAPLQHRRQISSSFGKKRVAAVGGHGWHTGPPKAAFPGPGDEQQMGTPPAKEMRTGQRFFSKLLPKNREYQK